MKITEHHTFVKQLDGRLYSKSDVKQILDVCNEDISEKIERLDIFNETRDNVSKRMLSKLCDICSATLLLNTFKCGYQQASIQLAWEQSLLDIKTKYLGSFLKGIKYIGSKIPQNGQSERLLLKYYDYLWQIRNILKSDHRIDVLSNLEKFPLNTDKTDEEYYSLVAETIEKAPFIESKLTTSRYYIQKKTPFFIGRERYYEITLQLAGLYATKYNRITVYTQEQIPSNYSIKIAYEERSIQLWEIATKIKILTKWEVSIEPSCLNKLSKALLLSTKISSNHGEYVSLMNFLRCGVSILDLIDFDEEPFVEKLNKIYSKTNTSQFRDVLIKLHNSFSKVSRKKGKNCVRFLLSNLREEDFEKILINQFATKRLSDDLNISSKCYPFEKRPFVSSIAGSNTSNGNSLQKIIDIAGIEEYNLMRPYVTIQNHIKETGEIYFDESLIENLNEIVIFNDQLDSWEKRQGHEIENTDGQVFIKSYEEATLCILEKLLKYSKSGNAGQEAYNRHFIEKSQIIFEDKLKEIALRKAFVNSKVLMIYGAAGTEKTLLINYLSNLMNTKSITNIQRLAERLGLFNLAKQHFRIKEEGIPNLEFLEYVLSKELEMRDDKRIRTMKDKARLPEEKRLEEFNLDYQTGITKFMLDKLSEAEWIEDKYNLLIMGSSGVGKTHLATGLAIKAIERGNKVFYTTLDNLLYYIKTKDTISKSKSRLNYINECKLLILDEVGYLPLGADDAKTVYSFIDSINKKISLIIITNREFEKWKELFHDEVIAMTLLDRITEKCQVIKLTGESYRFLNHKNIYTKKQNK